MRRKKKKPARKRFGLHLSLCVLEWASPCVYCACFDAAAWASPLTTRFLTWYQSLTTERGCFWRLKWRRRSKDSSKQATGKKLSHSSLFLLDSACEGTWSRAEQKSQIAVRFGVQAEWCIFRGRNPIGFVDVIFAVWGRFGPRFRAARLRTTISGYAVISVVLTKTVCTGYRFRICKFWGVCHEANTKYFCKQVVVCMYFLSSQWKRLSGVLLCTSTKRLQKTCLLFGIRFWHNGR